MTQLTGRRREILQAIIDYVNERGVSPTMRELGERFNVAKSACCVHVRGLHREGYLRHEPADHRGIVLLRDPEGRPIRVQVVHVQEAQAAE